MAVSGGAALLSGPLRHFVAEEQRRISRGPAVSSEGTSLRHFFPQGLIALKCCL